MTRVSSTAVIGHVVETWIGEQRAFRALLAEGPPIGVNARGEIVSHAGPLPVRVWVAAERGAVFVMSADPAHPAFVVGGATCSFAPAALSATWSRLVGPQCIDVGGGILVTARAVTGRDDASRGQTLPAQSKDADVEPPTRPEGLAAGPPSGATRLQPLHVPTTRPAPVAPTAPVAATAPVAPTAPVVRSGSARLSPRPPPEGAALEARGPAVAPSRGRQLAAAWRGLSRTTRIIAVGFTSLALVAPITSSARGQRHSADGPTGEAAADVRPAGGGQRPRGRAAAASTSLTPPSSSAVAGNATSIAAPPPPSPFVALGAPEGDSDSPLAVPRDRAGERRVAEAMFAGDYARAAAEGRRLADAHPESPEYPVVARVLRAKAARSSR